MPMFTNDPKRGVPWTLFLAALIFTVLVAYWVSPGRGAQSQAPDSVTFTVQSYSAEPYGGCKEAANYPWTRGWRWCVRNGHVEANLRPCRWEDGPAPCVWDARHRGNGKGRSFILRRHKAPRYVGHRLAHVLVANWRENVR